MTHEEEIMSIGYEHFSAIELNDINSRWTINSLLNYEGIAFMVARPKATKTWFAFDMVVSIASGTPCLGCFSVDEPGPVLLFAGEGARSQIRLRIDAICRHRGVDPKALDIFSISEPSLLLDDPKVWSGFEALVMKVKPRLILLDPITRIHRLNENDAGQISGFLSRFRELQLKYHCLILFTHHTGKKSHSNQGSNLRGSTDLHAIGDNYIFLSRNEEIVTVATEHRDAPSIDPFYMTLVSDDQDCTHLEIIDRGNKDDSSQSLRKDPRDRVLQYLENIDEPVSASILRSKINMNNQVLCDILNNLQNEGIISRTRKGVALMKNVTPMTSLESDDSLEPFLS